MDTTYGKGDLHLTFVDSAVVAILEVEETLLPICSAAPAKSLEEDCAFCWAPLGESKSSGEALRNPKCMHVYHRDCIRSILPSTNLCPVCRVEWYDMGTKHQRQIARIVRDTLDHLEVHGLFDLAWVADEVRDHKTLRERLTMTARIAAYCLQVQDIASRDWTQKQGSRLDRPDLRAEALEDEAIMQEVALSYSGYYAVGCLLQHLNEVTVVDIIACAISDPDSAGERALETRLADATAKDWHAGCGADGRWLSPTQYRFVLRIAGRAVRSIVVPLREEYQAGRFVPRALNEIDNEVLGD